MSLDHGCCTTLPCVVLLEDGFMNRYKSLRLGNGRQSELARWVTYERPWMVGTKAGELDDY